ncbi:polyamine ABC transporter ATP-binding protein [Amphritea sp. 2_MG-2023]|jgi:putrescine transport system ATP-binding protein|uniref:ABC transporter ATP-binding protein n=1 Tax=Amphritea TaxID=515417 RepID=UPI001C066420|nr:MULTISPECIES: polyamine ABC transporter ATP-binding protein [Amphritea]MBU2966807.1 polyamine ABC transporter ATP-binding protein [Amphritea atlantica]MDO6420662.1 polyamine ABC transporter ATP-binding protein [Amphritea sp. 2_MG-2023]
MSSTTMIETPSDSALEASPQITELPLWKQEGATPFLRIENVTKKFGDFTAVDNISLDIYKNELFCLLGGSGSGKSTLLRMLAGFESPTSGRIIIDGVDMSGIQPWKRPINMMFQSYALFPHLSVEDNVAFGLKREGLGRTEVKQRVAKMLDMVQLDHLGKRKPHQLSGGQRQRVALARSLVKRPKLLLLDEPLGALDKKLREETQFELINIQEELGVTFVVVTHDQEEAMTLATRIGVMNHGVIVQTAEPHDVYEYPNSRFVAQFVGSVNLFEGRVIEDQPDSVRINSQEAGAVLYVSHGISCAPNQKVHVAVRPEKMRISRQQPDQQENCVCGVVEEYAYMGGLTVYRVRLASGKEVRVTQPNISRASSERLTWNEQVYLFWDLDSSVVLTA